MKSKSTQSAQNILVMLFCSVMTFLAANAQVVSKAEYFFDADPGVGNAAPISVPSPSADITISISIATTGLSTGKHFLYIRSMDDTGQWSMYEQRMIEIKSSIAAAEYFFDTDPGVGQATPISITPSESEISSSAICPTTSLISGKHFLYIRTRDQDGRWSLYEQRMFEVKPKITGAEYFVDTDPGVGNGTPISVATSEDEITRTFNVPTTGLNPGKHFVFIRTKNEKGSWGLQEPRMFEVKQEIVAAEYFVDTDPGVGNGTPITITPNENEIIKTFNALTAGAGVGKHFLYIRTKNNTGSWGLSEPRMFEVKPKMVAAEYFVDTDPGVGNGIPISVIASEIEIIKTLFIPTTGLAGGKHFLYVRAKDVNGSWGLQEARAFEVREKIVAAEYFYDQDPGTGNGNSLNVSSTETQLNVTGQANTYCLSQGTHYLYLRTMDARGRWSLFEPDTLTVSGVAPEVCGNLVDDDCDGLVDEECSPIVNDTFAAATNVSVAGVAYPAGNCYNGTLGGASVSPQGTSGNVAPGGGQDVWYKIIAPSTALRAVTNTSSMNIVLELHNAAGVQLDVENDVATLGGEIMTTGNLTAGATYYIAVRSYDGTLGNFNICVQALLSSFNNSGTGPFNLCTNMKAKYTGADIYTYNFDPTGATPGGNTSISTGAIVSLASPSLSLRFSSTYDTWIDATYNLADGAGNLEIITVPGTTIVPIVMGPHESVEVKEEQRCGHPATLLRGSILVGKPYVCAATGYVVRFTQVTDCSGSATVGLPFTVNTPGASASLYLNFNLPQPLLNNAYYVVEFQPLFGYGPGNYGLPRVIKIAGNAMQVLDLEDEFMRNEKEMIVNPEAAIYPNPNNGQLLNINLTGIERDAVYVRIMDNAGKLVYNNQYVVDGSLSTTVLFEYPLASGLYFVEFITGEKTITQKMIVQK